MRKFFIVSILFFFFIFILVYDSESVLIPDNAIRFRVIANSDSFDDQTIKKMVGLEVEKQLSLSLEGVRSIDDARDILKSSVGDVDMTVSDVLLANNVNENFSVNYGMNFFPEKKYKGYTYSAGDYESLVITLGEGNGNNWWCVLFPPLCLLEAEEVDDTDDVQYSFFLLEWLDKYFN